MNYYHPLVALHLLGIIVAAYLYWERIQGKKPQCVIGSKCSLVLESPYNKLFGIHNDVAGLLFYVGMLTILFMLRREIGPIELLLSALRIMALLGAIGAGVFMTLQWKVIKAWCFWCIVMNINTCLIAVLIIGII